MSDDAKCSSVTEHRVWGVRTGQHCRRCGDRLYRHMPNGMCPECVRETPGTDECHICREHGEGICGYHSTCLWYCFDCGHVRRVGNRPVRPESGVTIRCCVSLHPERSPFDLPEMTRLCYESVAPPALRRYHRARGEAWNEATRRHSIDGESVSTDGGNRFVDAGTKQEAADG